MLAKKGFAFRATDDGVGKFEVQCIMPGGEWNIG